MTDSRLVRMEQVKLRSVVGGTPIIRVISDKGARS